MFKKLLAIFISIFITSISYAGEWRVVETVASEDTSTAVDVPTTLARYSKSFSLKGNTYNTPVGVMYKAASDGVVAVTLQVQQSHQAPTTELADDTAYVVWEASESVTDTNWHLVTLDTVLMPYARFKLTGTGSNNATTEIQLKVIKQ